MREVEAVVFTRIDARRRAALTRAIVSRQMMLLGSSDSPAPRNFIDLDVTLRFRIPVEIYVDCPEKISNSKRCKILFLLEPEVVSKAALATATKNLKFDAVFGHDDEAVRLCRSPASFRFGHGGSWVATTNAPEVLPKANAVSMICGDKMATVGHALRRLVYETADVVRFRSSSSPSMRGETLLPEPADKARAISPFKFHVVVENVRRDGYFTEKLLDCFLLETLPIYWGDPNLSNIFDPRGFIAVDSYEDMLAKIAGATAKDYQDRLPALRRNKEIAKRDWIDLESRMQRAVDDFLSDENNDTVLSPSVEEEISPRADG